jgi:rubrerythrin
MKICTLAPFAALILAIGCGGGQPAPAEPAAPAPAVDTATPLPAEPPAPAEPPKPVLKTMDNLQAAHVGETNAITRYMAFAEAADKEGYKNVGRLFRAAARAEEIHAEKIGKIIMAKGGSPEPGDAKPEVKTTAENVKAALAGESAESGTMYPGFAETAKAEGNAEAEQLFKGFQAVEAEHAKLYEDTDKNLAAWKKGKKNIWVCPVCGNVMTSNKAPCAVCTAPAKEFEAIK